MVKKAKTIIGWEEWCALPHPAVKAKIDAGAKTSALHAYDIQVYDNHRVPFVRFKVQPLQTRKKLVRVCEAPLVERRVITTLTANAKNAPS